MRLRSLHVSVPIYCHMVAVCQEVSAEKCLLRSVCREVSAEKCLPNSIMVYSRSLSIVIGSGGRTEIRSGGGGSAALGHWPSCITGAYIAGQLADICALVCR